MPGVGRRRFSYTPAGRRMDRRGGARMGMLSKASNPFGMKRKSPMGKRPMKRKSY